MGQVSVVLPKLESDAMLLPDPYIVQVVQKPRNRQASEQAVGQLAFMAQVNRRLVVWFMII